ncbi:hypothetical protein Tco_1097884 [Tanacetum coccineum]
MGSLLVKDPAPHLTAHQEQAVHILSTNKAPFRRYPECFLVLVGLTLYYPFDENTYLAFEGPDKKYMGLLDYIRTANPRKVQAVEVEKGEEQVKLLDSIKHCFVSLDAPVVAQQEGGSGSGAGAEVSALEEHVVAKENIVSMGTYLDLVDPEDDLTVVERGDAARKQPEKVKRKKLSKQCDTFPAKRLRVDHPSLASGTGGKTLASLRQTIPEVLLHWSLLFRRISHVADAPVYTSSDTMASSRGKAHAAPMSDMGGSSQLETSEDSADSFYETAALNAEDSKRWYIPRWNITNDSLLDDGFSCRTSRAEHELELKEKLRAKCDAQDVLLKGKYVEIARLKSLVKEKETEFAKASRLRDQVSVLTAEKSSLSAEMSTLKSVVSQKETDISLLDSRATYLKSCLDDSQAACTEARNLISALTSERDGLASEVSTLHSAFRDFKERMEAQQEAQAQVLYNRVAELEAHVSTLHYAFRDFKEKMEAQQEAQAQELYNRVAGTPLSAVTAYSLEAAEAKYLDAIKALEEADFPFVQLLKSKKDSGMDELSIPIYHSDVNAVVGETSLSFTLLNTLVGEASTSTATLSVEDLDTDEDLGSVVCMPHFEDLRFEILS